MDEANIRCAIRGWIANHARVAVTEIGDGTLLLERRIITSLDVVELLMFLEELRGSEIDTDEIDPHNFASVDAIVSRFFGFPERRSTQVRLTAG